MAYDLYGNMVGGAAFQTGLNFLQPKPQAAAPGAQGSPLDDLFKQLMASMLSGNSYKPPSQSNLQSQAAAAVDAKYGPQAAALRRAMGQARSNAAYSNQAIGKLFSGLAGSYKADKKDTKKLFKESKEAENARLKQYTDNVKDNYKASMQSLNESFAQLGIQAAAGDSTTGALAKDEAFNLQAAAKDSDIEQQALNQESRGEQIYWQKGMGTAKMEGTQRQADLEQTLNAFLMDSQGKLADLEAQRKIEYEGALAKLQQEVAKQASDQSNKTWSQLLQAGNFQMSLGRYNKDMAKTSSIGKGLTGANQYLTQQFQNSQWGPSEAERYSGILQGIILNIPTGTSPEEAANYAAEEANRRGISPSVLSRAMLAYYGRL